MRNMRTVSSVDLNDFSSLTYFVSTRIAATNNNEEHNEGDHNDSDKTKPSLQNAAHEADQTGGHDAYGLLLRPSRKPSHDCHCLPVDNGQNMKHTLAYNHDSDAGHGDGGDRENDRNRRHTTVPNNANPKLSQNSTPTNCHSSLLKLAPLLLILLLLLLLAAALLLFLLPLSLLMLLSPTLARSSQSLEPKQVSGREGVHRQLAGAAPSESGAATSTIERRNQNKLGPSKRAGEWSLLQHSPWHKFELVGCSQGRPLDQREPHSR